jgi:carboxymethylenebutenolidase
MTTLRDLPSLRRRVTQPSGSTYSPGGVERYGPVFIDWLAGRLDDFAIVSLKEAIRQLGNRADVDAERIGAVGFCIGGTVAITWACTDNRLKAIAPYYGSAPRRREAMRRLCPVVGSWPDKDFTTGAASTLENELTAAGVAHDLKIYPGSKHALATN